MGIQAVDSIIIIAGIFNKKTSPYLLGLFLLAVWLDSHPLRFKRFSYKPPIIHEYRETLSGSSSWKIALKTHRIGKITTQQVRTNQVNKVRIPIQILYVHGHLGITQYESTRFNDKTEPIIKAISYL